MLHGRRSGSLLAETRKSGNAERRVRRFRSSALPREMATELLVLVLERKVLVRAFLLPLLEVELVVGPDERALRVVAVEALVLLGEDEARLLRLRERVLLVGLHDLHVLAARAVAALALDALEEVRGLFLLRVPRRRDLVAAGLPVADRVAREALL